MPEDPLQTAVGILLRNHPHTPVHRLPITRRLDTPTAAVARLFYPDLHFSAAVLPGVRDLRLGKGARPSHRLDSVLDIAATSGWAHAESPRAPVLQADPEAVELTARLVERLFERDPAARCERGPIPTPHLQTQVAVGVSHNDQSEG